MNITLIIVLLLIIGKAISGFRTGMVKQITGLIAWTITLFVMSVIIMLYTSFYANEARNTIYSILILIVVGLVYGVVRFVLKSAKLISKLPIIHQADKLAGFVIGAGEGLLIVWLLYVLNEGGLFGQFESIIHQNTADSFILSIIYEYNYLAKLVAGF